MGESKQIFDIVFITDKELGINSGKTNGRPCIIFKLDEEQGDENYVIPMTTQKQKHWDNNSNRLLLSNGSYVSLTDAPIRIPYRMIKYAELSDDIYLTFDDIDDIENNF